MAIEDAAVLGNLLSRLTHPSHLPILLRGYEALRLPRTAETQNQSRLNQKIFHLPDGDEQRRRDADMRRATEGELRKLRERGFSGSTTTGLKVKEGKGEAEGSANQWADEAIEALVPLPDSVVKSALCEFAHAVVHRTG